MSLYDKFYQASPIWLQNLGLQGYGYYWHRRRFGKGFLEKVEQYRQKENWTKDEWSEYQLKTFKKLLIHSYRFSTFYKDKLDRANIHPEDVKNWDDFSNIPFLSKQELRAFPDQLLTCKKVSRETRIYYSSGSTGTPIKIYYDLNTHQGWEAACEVFIRNWANVSSFDRRMMIGGRMIVPPSQKSGPTWRKVFSDNVIYLSAFHLNADNVPAMIDAVHQFKPLWSTGYGSGNYYIAQIALELGKTFKGLKSVITSSETIFPEMRKTMETAFQCKIFDQYGMVEACGMINQCEMGSYHIIPEIGIIEILDENDRPVKAEQEGEIVCTGLLNFQQPLIRYRLGDRAIATDKTCSCGRPLPLIGSIVGRVEDTLLSRDGHRMVRFHGIYIDLNNVKRGQIVQEDRENITLNIETTDHFTSQEQSILVQRIKDRLGEVRVKVNRYDQIPLGPTSKFRPVISKIKT